MNKQDIISALIDSYFDFNQEVSQASFNSLLTFSSKEINTVLLCCLTKFNDSKFNMRQITEIFKCIRLLEKITQELNSNELDKTINTNLVLFSINTLKKLYDTGSLKDQDLEQQCETIISNILTNIGKKNCDHVVNELLKQFSMQNDNQSNSQEHSFLIKTLGNMCIINPIGVSKFIKKFIQELWPLIKQAKTDNQRFILAHTVGCIGSAILENLANEKGKEIKEEITESNETIIEEYENDFDLIFDVFILWLQIRDNKTKEQIVKALGIIFQLISKQKFIENQNKLIELILSFYKKNLNVPFTSDFDSFYTTQTLVQFLQVCLQYDSSVMNSKLTQQTEIELDIIMNILFRQSLMPINTTQPNSINNHNEILRTFSILSIKNCSKVVNFILKKFEENSIVVKISGLSILKHLIDTRTNEIIEKFSSIFFALRLLVDEENNRLKKMLIQVIVSIAYKGYLNLEGGKFLIQFILKQCSKDANDDRRSIINRKQSNLNTFNSINQDQNQVTNATLKQMAENVLPLFVNTVEGIEKVLWPQLFEYLVLPEYVNATGIISNALFKMGEKLKSNNDPAFNVDFTKVVHLPKREEIMARLVILIGDDPLKSQENIKSCLNLMRIISTLIHPSLNTLWDTITNQYLDMLKLDEQLTKEDWQHKALALVNQSFIEIDDEEFILKFGKHLLDHLHFYNNSVDLKYFLLLVLANLIRRINKKKYTENIMDEVFSKIDHSNQIEREGCALLFGHCSAQYLDLVIVKLEQFYTEAQKGTGILSSILSLGLNKSTSRADIVLIKSTIILSLGYITKFAPTSLLITRIETPILNSIEGYYETSKDNQIVQESFIKCCKIIAVSMTPDNLKMIYMLKGRKGLIYEMINIAKQDTTSIQIKIQAIDCLGMLLSLDPVLNNTEKSTLIEIVTKIIFLSNNNELLKSFQFLIKNLLIKESKNTQNLSILFELIIPFGLTLKDEQQRLDVLRTIEFILDEFNKNIITGDFIKLESYCYLCALILPYCCDDVESMRKIALECICKLAIISVRLQSKNIEEDELIIRLTKLIEKSDSNLDYLTKELSNCMVIKLRNDNIQPSQLIIKLISSLNHYNLQKTYGASKIALGLTKQFVSELRNDVQKIIDTIYQTRLDYVKTNSVLVDILTEIANNHLNLFCYHLISFPIPFDDQLSKFWRSLSESPQLSKILIDWCLERLNEDNLILFDKRKTSNAIAKPGCLAIICGLNELFKNQDLYDIVHSNSDKIFASLLLTISSYINVDYIQDNPRRLLDQEFVNLPYLSEENYTANLSNNNSNLSTSSTANQSNSTIKSTNNSANSSGSIGENLENSSNEIKKFRPVKSAILTMKQYLNLLKYDTMLLTLESEGCWKLMEESNQFYSSICILAKSIHNYQPNLISKLVSPFTSSLNHKEINRRLLPLAFFSYLLSLNDFPDKETLSEPFLNTILNMCNDPSPIVRLYCVKSLGMIDQLNDFTSFGKYVLPVVSALVNSLDDSDDTNDRIKHESLNSLCLVLAKIDLKLIKNLVTNLVLRLKTFFNRDKFYIREKSVEAIGHLVKNNDLKDILLEELSSLIIHLLITLNDTVLDVVKATKFTIINVSKVLEIESLTNQINKNLIDKNNIHYNEFIYQISKIMVNEFNEQLDNFVSILLVYLKLDCVRVQCNSLQILGSLFNNDVKNDINDDLKQKTILLIIHFLKDSKNLELRIKAAEMLTNF